MNDVGAVNVLEAAQCLVQEVLEVIVAQRLIGADDLAQVGVHQIGDDVHVLEIILGRRAHDVADLQHLPVIARTHTHPSIRLTCWSQCRLPVDRSDASLKTVRIACRGPGHVRFHA